MSRDAAAQTGRTPGAGGPSLPLPVVAPASVPVVGTKAAFPVRRIYCVGRNYIEHIREMKEGDERDPPFFFQKPADAIVVDGIVPYPPLTEDFHYEVELVAAIGAPARDVAPERALDAVFGYTVGLDMTRRDRQREAGRKGLAWEIGKSFDHSAPCGPIHPVSMTGHLRTGAIELDVNGASRQRSVLEKMIWTVPEIISHLSRQYRLMPGDLILTGTPAGVGPVLPGDVIEARIAGLAPLRVKIAPSEL